MDSDELRNQWERETVAAEQALADPKITQLFKVSGQRLIIGVIDAESHHSRGPPGRGHGLRQVFLIRWAGRVAVTVHGLRVAALAVCSAKQGPISESAS
ncbi:hypothetical protein [Saccharopolyspora sp. NPDC050642]|uniref:hypothetical protein n=1 Tax=Saccharopolyspora sp. NPDC050642 TaxID=3157099 RepID=UPI003407E5C8